MSEPSILLHNVIVAYLILESSRLLERCVESGLACYVDVVHDYGAFQLRVRTGSSGYVILVIIIVCYLFIEN